MTAVIIIFNTDRFLTEQVRLLQKFVTDKIAVIDNSNDFEVAKKLKVICEENKVNYTKTAVNESDFSKSHAFACQIGIEMFRGKDGSLLMLDHDIFPIKQFEQPNEDIILAGIPQKRTTSTHVRDEKGDRYEFVYFWPGLLYINTEALTGYQIDIRPCEVMDVHLDTGGGLYKLISGNKERVKEFNEQHQYFDGEDNYSLIENCWMHFRNGSNWAKKENHDERINKLMSILYGNS